MMKKVLSVFTILFVISSTAYAASNDQYISPQVARGIQKYKMGNYIGCIQDINTYFQDKTKRRDQIANYYIAMAYTQAGNVERARFFYNLANSINPSNTIGQYAQKGLVCIDDPDNCYINVKEETKQEVAQSELDKFINAPYGNGLSDNLNKELERKRVEKLRKEMNSDEELNKFEFKDFRKFTIDKNKKSYNLNGMKIAQSVKDFYAEHSLDGVKIASSSNPTDAEIVEALRVLNAAGLTNIAKQAENAQAQKQEPQEAEAVSEVRSEYKPDLTREQYQQQIQREMMQAQMAQMAQPNIGALFGEKNNNQNDMMNSNMMNMLPFMMAQQAAQNANGSNQQPMMSPEMMQTMMLNSMMPNMNFGLGGNN